MSKKLITCGLPPLRLPQRDRVPVDNQLFERQSGIPVSCLDNSKPEDPCDYSGLSALKGIPVKGVCTLLKGFLGGKVGFGPKRHL